MTKKKGEKASFPGKMGICICFYCFVPRMHGILRGLTIEKR